MKTSPKIQKYMTPMPHTIGKDIPLKKAFEMMREHRIRHLPVQDGGHLVGVITDRDIKFASSFAGAAELKVEDAMTPDPYKVSPDALVEDVAEAMAERKYGCAIVEQGNGKVVGIFTEIDALRVLAEVLKQR
jgi:acetoin utilization protein AcuB